MTIDPYTGIDREAYDLALADDEPYYDGLEHEGEFISCSNPGRRGCGECDGCLAWADDREGIDYS